MENFSGFLDPKNALILSTLGECGVDTSKIKKLAQSNSEKTIQLSQKVSGFYSLSKAQKEGEWLTD